MAESKLEWQRGTVQNANANGVKLQGQDGWLNWSQYVPEDARTQPARGTKVRVGLDSRNFVREITSESGDKLDVGVHSTGGGAGGGGGYGMPPESQWRVTLLSALSSAVNLMQTVGDEQLGGQKRTDATYALAVHWARKAWTEPMPAMPRTVTDSDDAGDE
jgi:hypothetical protein